MRTTLDSAGDTQRLVVIANREPFRHSRTAGGEIVLERSASGVVTALEPVLASSGGVWVAHGAGSADKAAVDVRDGLNVPPASPRYRLRRVWLDAAEEQGYYRGFANEALWPLCHAVHVPPVFRTADFQHYETVNARFADAACEEAGATPALFFVNDYHFALLPRMLALRKAAAAVATFWHIPWPAPRTFRTCPWARRLLDGLLGSRVLGFQTTEDCLNFVDCVEGLLGVKVDRRENLVSYRDQQTLVRAYPVGIEWPNPAALRAPAAAACRAQVLEALALPPHVLLGVGIDRLDYTKGLAEKCLAIERLLELRPEFRGRFVFVQATEPSREQLPAYRAERARLVSAVQRVNARFATDDWRPVILLERRHESGEVYRLYRAADLCYVGSLHDGMNLVAKEFAAARDDLRGVLVLSEFAGAARQLEAALTVNPYAIDETAGTLGVALSMTPEEQAHRMGALRAQVAAFNARWWASRIIDDATRMGGPRVIRRLPARPQAQPLSA